MVKGKIKPTSIRIPERLLEKIDTICSDASCSRNDFITTALDEAVHNEVDETDEQEPKPIPKVIIDLNDEPKPRVTGKIISVDGQAVSEIKEPKVVVKEVPQDNSNKPPVQMAWFNGKLLPFAKRYNI